MVERPPRRFRSVLAWRQEGLEVWQNHGRKPLKHIENHVNGNNVGMKFIEGSLEVKLPTIWTYEKHSHEEAEPGRNSDVEKVR